MSLLYIAGLSSNLVTGATLSSTDANASFPLTNLQLDYGWRMFRFNTAATNGTLTADLGSAVPVTFSSIHFHNIGSGITTVTLTSDSVSNFATPTSRGTFTVSSPSFYLSFAAGSSERYWRVTFNGTNAAGAIYIGRWVLGVTSSLTEVQQNAWGINYEREQISPALGLRVNRAVETRRILSLPFRQTTIASKDEILTLLEGCEYGAEPLIVVPDSTEAMVVYGRPRNAISVARSADTLHELDLEVAEDYFPVITA